MKPTEPASVLFSSDVQDAIRDLEAKYESLVWYARSQPATATTYWEKVPPEIRDGAFRAQMKVEEDHPDEITELRNCEDNWTHGFNSGVLAALRFVATAQYPFLIDDEEGTPYLYGGVHHAIEEFPCLDI
jgi:hypothetical protein